MRDVTIHTIFWAPSGYAFSGSPGGGALGYVPLVQQFFTDVATASGTTDEHLLDPGPVRRFARPGLLRDPLQRRDGLDHRHGPVPGPPASSARRRMTSPPASPISRSPHEIDKVIQTDDPSGRGLSNIWEVFLPPNVDECIDAGVVWDERLRRLPLLGGRRPRHVHLRGDDRYRRSSPRPSPGPTRRAILMPRTRSTQPRTRPSRRSPTREGVGWMDANGYEVADKCENSGLVGQEGSPLGLRAGRLAVRPADQRPRVRDPADVVQRRRRVPQSARRRPPTTCRCASVSLRQFSPGDQRQRRRAVGGVRVGIRAGARSGLSWHRPAP